MTDLLLIDGSNLLFQMFFGMPARIVNRDGRAIQGTLGFVGALLKILRRTEPKRIAVLFDGEHANPHAQIAPDYKANRTDYTLAPPEETPFSQLPDICAALDYLGIRHAETTGCEADDWLAGYALTFGVDHDVLIVSQDSDLFQLITPRVSVLRYRGERTVVCTPGDIRTKFGIEPSCYADFKALVGDASDNLRGAPGIGPKTAAALLREFGSLEAILSRVEQIPRASIRASLAQNETILRRNRALIELSVDAVLPFSPEELIFAGTSCTTTEVLAAIGVK